MKEGSNVHVVVDLETVAKIADIDHRFIRSGHELETALEQKFKALKEQQQVLQLRHESFSGTVGAAIRDLREIMNKGVEASDMTVLQAAVREMRLWREKQT
jgi:hypothetical protein